MPGVISRAAVLLTVIAVSLSAAYPLSVPSAFACSCGGTMIENAASAEMVVVGTVTSWSPTGARGVTMFTPLELTLHVERVLKGDPGDTIRFVDSASYVDSGEGTHYWAGGSGACGTFDADPTGNRALYALRHRPDGNLGAGRCSGTYLGIGADPNGVGGSGSDSYIAQVEAALAAFDLPRTGAGPVDRERLPDQLGPLAVGGAGLALTMLALLLRRRASETV